MFHICFRFWTLLPHLYILHHLIFWKLFQMKMFLQLQMFVHPHKLKKRLHVLQVIIIMWMSFIIVILFVDFFLLIFIKVWKCGRNIDLAVDFIHRIFFFTWIMQFNYNICTNNVILKAAKVVYFQLFKVQFKDGYNCIKYCLRIQRNCLQSSGFYP